MTSKISELPLDDKIRQPIIGCAGQAAKLLGIDLSIASPSQVIESVDQCVFELQKGERELELAEEDDPALILGSLWGEQLVKVLHWEWATVVFHAFNDAKAVGVFPPDRSMAIYPFHFIHGCLENNASVTIALASNMLLDGTRIPKFPAHTYEDIMDGIHHAIPRD